MRSRVLNWGKTPWKISFRSKLSRLREHVDIAIIGGGFTGLAAAALARCMAPDKSVLLLEAARIGNGASGRTGGMALSQTAAGDLPGLGDVLAGYTKILRELGVKADLDLHSVWEIARGDHSMEGKKIHPLPNSPIDWTDSGRVRAVKKVPGGTVNPGKVVDGLARAATRAGAAIAEEAEVTRIELRDPIRLHVRWKFRGSVIRKIIAANRVLQATNAGGLALAEDSIGKNHHGEPKLTFALATAPLTKKQIAALGMKSGRPFYTVDLPYLWGRLFQTKSFRGKTRFKNRGMIFGSGLVPGFGESGAKKSIKKLWSGLEREDVRRGDSAQRLRSLEERVRSLHAALQNVRITHRWGGPILITKGFIPIFRAHPKNKNLVFLGGFSGHGVALSVYLARHATEVLLGKRTLPKWS